MDFLAQLNSKMPEIHFYIMWFSLLVSGTCVVSQSTCKLFKPNYIKIIIFLLLIFAGFTWVNDVTEMKNTPDFSDIPDKLELETKKYEFAKLQRNVYLEGLEVYSLLLILLIPAFHSHYMGVIRALERRLEEFNKRN